MIVVAPPVPASASASAPARRAHVARSRFSTLLESVASQHVGRQLSAAALVLATIAGVWIGVDAPEVSPVDAPQTAAAGATP